MFHSLQLQQFVVSISLCSQIRSACIMNHNYVYGMWQVPPPLDVLRDLTTREDELAHNTTKDLDWEEDI